ncbi:hypothetical protein AAMO2058_000289400 [Amorphochlora amoebiformis]|mmetsp:Transcript_6503/g.10015  ORF Transcript_6503/g.10015 Transcript_6503/m.10015 type:complete len:100 (-) Transcript_6503:110-409(-)
MHRVTLLKEFASRRSIALVDAAEKLFGSKNPYRNRTDLDDGKSRFKANGKGPALLRYYDDWIPKKSFMEIADYRKEKLQILKDTGRTPPAKGSGKRSKK